MKAPLLHCAVATVVLSLTACASTPPVAAEWKDATLGSQSHLLQGATVMVACETPDLALRNLCQDQLAAQVRERGAVPVIAPAGITLLTDRPVDAQLLPGARNAGAKAMLVVGVAPASSEQTSGLSIGIGGFGFGRGSALGGGIAAPIGGGRVETGFAANGRVTDVASGRLVWTATAAAQPSDDLRAQLAQLARAVLDAAARAGLF